MTAQGCIKKDEQGFQIESGRGGKTEGERKCLPTAREKKERVGGETGVHDEKTTQTSKKSAGGGRDVLLFSQQKSF